MILGYNQTANKGCLKAKETLNQTILEIQLRFSLLKHMLTTTCIFLLSFQAMGGSREVVSSDKSL